MLHVVVKLAFLNATFIHPFNTSYPMFTVGVKQTEVQYTKRIDCDEVKVKIGNLQVFDNTDYPRTKTPYIYYTSDDPVVSNEILGVNILNEDVNADMLSLEMFIFAHPGPQGSCQFQTNKDFDMTMKMKLSQVKFLYMQECTLRIVDYFMQRIMRLLSVNSKVEDEDGKEDYGEEGDGADDLMKRLDK